MLRSLPAFGRTDATSKRSGSCAATTEHATIRAHQGAKSFVFVPMWGIVVLPTLPVNKIRGEYTTRPDEGFLDNLGRPRYRGRFWLLRAAVRLSDELRVR